MKENIKKLKLVTILGTRPEIIRLSRIINNCDKFFEHILIHTGQNFDYELNKIFFEELSIRKPDYFINSADKSISPSNTIGNLIISIDKLFEKISPEAVLVLGDTNSALSVIPAKRRKIPIFHIEAGNRCFDQRVPEEINRKIVDHTSDINLTYSSIARNYLIREGFPSDQIIKIGSPMKEILDFYKNDIYKSNILKELNLSKNKYFLVSMHREENIDNDNLFKKLINCLNQLAEDYQLPIIFSTHPRTRKKIKDKKIIFNPLVRLLDPLGFFNYVNLQLNAKCVLSDSGTIVEEASILAFPALIIRETFERPEIMEEGSIIMVGPEYNRISQSLEILDQIAENRIGEFKIVQDYNTNNVSLKVTTIIQSYTDFVRRFVWKEYK